MTPVNLAKKLAQFNTHWDPHVVADYNDNDVMVVKFQGEFPFHLHEDTDDFFLVLKGEIDIEMRDRTVTLSAGEGQRLNISLTRFNRQRDQSYGTLRDMIWGRVVSVTSRDRTQHLMTTAGNEAQLQLAALTSDTNFLLDIQGFQ